MKVTILILLSTIALSFAHIQWSEESSHFYSFNDYEIEFVKKYANEQEFQFRKSIFESNLEKILKINNDSSNTWKAGVNDLTDRTDSELESLRGYNKGLANLHKKQTAFKFTEVNLTNLPTSVDWREKGVVNNVKDQSACGSCWAFSTTSVFESHIAIQTGKLFNLSEQQLVDCVQNPHHCGGKGGCEGATQELGFDYYHTTGGAIENSNYKYRARDGTCQDTKFPKVASIDGYRQLKTNDYNDLLQTLATEGPVSISVDATTWSFYSGGILNFKDCGSTINHAVVAVGYGEENGKKYWIVRNSWGSGWGENGYIRIAREDSAADVTCAVDKDPASGSGCDGGPSQITVCGTCGIYSDSSIPFGGKIHALGFGFLK